jgi:hypothetical protein
MTWPWSGVDKEGVLELGARQPACVVCMHTAQGVFLCWIGGSLRDRDEVVPAPVARSGGKVVEVSTVQHLPRRAGISETGPGKVARC